MTIFVGLGNSDTKYLSTKHNVGFWMMDRFAKAHNLEFQPGKGNYIFAKKGSEFLLVKPTTGMNNSGTIIRDVLNFYKADTKNLVIVFDDVDLPLGEIRVKIDGGDGCHNGMKSIIQSLATDKIARLKIGIAAPDYRRPSERYVLKPFNKKFHPLVDEVLSLANDAMLSMLHKGANETMNNFNKQNIGVA
ncbi:MAG: aminoacyl-tRNA hydrolase [Candidatus Neomarinimicrobiota bacterium]|nr:aminoacyl-tRNA hydrolase [Candidatus Neomarinimicrobiota bacterium]